MILEFAIQNFRSIKDEQVLSLLADSGKKKNDNLANINNELRILKSAVIYGPNASGKTNIIRAFYNFITLIKNSIKYKNGESIEEFEPFQLDVQCREKPTSFKLDFLQEQIKYTYEICFNKEKIVDEILLYYPKGAENSAHEIFTRRNDKIILGNAFEDKAVSTKVLKNRLFLSEIGGGTSNEQLGKIYLYLSEIVVWNGLDNSLLGELVQFVEKRLAEENDENFKQSLSRLISIADTKIEGISSKKVDNTQFKFPEDIPEDIKTEILSHTFYKTSFYHKVFDGKKEIDMLPFNLKDESAGTQVLFALGGLILDKLMHGGVIIFDEFDSSLHPKLSKFLVSLFHHPIINTKGSQLIFATHETTLLDKSLFRKDQIWFTQKNSYGESELFSASDFEDARDDIPFEKWYLQGKFGGLPNIREMDFIFSNEQEKKQKTAI